MGLASNMSSWYVKHMCQAISKSVLTLESYSVHTREGYSTGMTN